MTFLIDIESKDIWRILGLVSVLVAILWLAVMAAQALGVVLIALFIAVAVHLPVTFLAEKLPMGGRRLAAFIVYTLIALLIGLVGYLVIPLIVSQGRELLARLPEYMAGLTAGNHFLADLVEGAAVYLEVFALNAVRGIIFSAEATLAFAVNMVGNFIYFLFTIVISFVMAVEAPRVLNTIDTLLPDGARRHVRALRRRMFKAVSGFVTGQVLITTLAATVTFVLLTVLGIPAPLSLAATIWLTGLIPLIGNTLGAIIVVVVALSQSLLVALFLAIYYVVYQQVENNVLEPIIQSRTVKLTPLIVLVSAIIGIRLAGFAGALLAIPAGACVRIAFEYWLEQRRLRARD